MTRNNALQLTGRRFGRLRVVAETNRRSRNGQIVWQCVCDCGGTAFVMTTNLTSGNTLSCGCWQREISRAVNQRNP